MDIATSATDGYYLPGNRTVNNQPRGLTDPDVFLKILVAQMKYQDPMEPQDSSTFINQLAQMATMEQMYNVSKSMDKLSAGYEMARYFDLIGKQVTIMNTDQSVLTGEVGGIVFKEGKPYFYLKEAPDGEKYSLDQVTKITGSPPGNITSYLSLVDQQVKLSDGITGVVEKVLLQSGNIKIQVNGSTYSADQVIEIHGAPQTISLSEQPVG